MATKICNFMFVWLFAFAMVAMPVKVIAEKKITIGGKNFTEQYILPELAKILLEKNGFKVKLRTGVGCCSPITGKRSG